MELIETETEKLRQLVHEAILILRVINIGLKDPQIEKWIKQAQEVQRHETD